VVEGLLRGALAAQFAERFENHPDFSLADTVFSSHRRTRQGRDRQRRVLLK
jgi:hypothetical protein